VAAVPTVSNLNFSAGQKPVPNKVDVRLSSNGRIKLFNAAGSVSVVGDVVGYYTKSSLSEIADRLRSIEDSRSFAVTARESSPSDIVDEEEVVVSVTLVASADGQVTVNSSMSVETLTSGDTVTCTITRGTVLNRDYEQVWETPGASHLSGSRTFDIAAGTTVTYNLVCYYSEVGTVFATPIDPVLTAIFTPAP
jgi:hypothetical protein